MAAAAVHREATGGLCGGKPKRGPGERIERNNCDTLVLGAVIEKITGRPFAAVLKARIAVQLGLTSLRMADDAAADGKIADVANATDLHTGNDWRPMVLRVPCWVRRMICLSSARCYWATNY